MVIILLDQLIHLTDCIFSAIRHMLGDIGDLCPNNKTALVAQIIEILIVLIMSQTNGSSADLANEIDILLVMLGKQRVTYAPAVLMTGNTAERIAFAVEDKALVGIYLKGAASEAGAYIV